MLKEGLLKELDNVKEFFERSTRCLEEKDSAYSPKEDMLPVVHHVAHAAQSIDWFIDGMCSPEGFDTNFENHWKDVTPCTSLSQAREWFSKSIQQAKTVVDGMSEEQLRSPLPQGMVMGGSPKLAVIGAISEHTAHHRGALSVYSRLIGYKPVMPYMDE